ncbi:MAG: VOC family protein [Chthonomonadales bacterium]
MKVSETIYFVRDLDKEVDLFTRVLGFRLVEKKDWGFALVESLSGVKIGLLLEKWMRSETVGTDELPRPRIAFQTRNIESEVVRLRAAGVRATDPEGEDHQTKSATFWDADGNAFFLWQEPQRVSTF